VLHARLAYRFDATAAAEVPAYPQPVRLLLMPLWGGMFVIFLAIRIVILAALVDALVRPDRAYVAADKQTKLFWCLVLVVGLFLSIVGLIAAIVYFVDVRPAVRAVGGGGQPPPSSSDGPYGPYRR
jgi:uncharacterized membrane protein